MPAKGTRKAAGKTAKKVSPSRKEVNISISADEDICKGFEQKVKKGCCTGAVHKNACGGFAYFLAFIGAVVYYISTATGFWNGVWGVVKALLWPAFLLFELMKFLNM